MVETGLIDRVERKFKPNFKQSKFLNDSDEERPLKLAHLVLPFLILAVVFIFSPVVFLFELRNRYVRKTLS